MKRPPPRSPLFPSTTPFRCAAAAAQADAAIGSVSARRAAPFAATRTAPGPAPATATAPSADRGTRSEEHTSELQSRQYLVCPLLLEKKKQSSLSLVTRIFFA